MKTTKLKPKTVAKKSIAALPSTSAALTESLKRIVTHAKKNKFAQCVYKDGESRCPVGIFFTEEQLDYVIAMTNDEGDSMNGDNVLSLAQVLGADNIEAVTGMNPEQAFMIQHLNDIEGPLVMLKFIEEILIGKRSMIGDVAFNVQKVKKKL